MFASSCTRRYFTKLIFSISRNKGYTPVNLVSKVILPKCGEDKSLYPIVFVHGLTASKELWENVPQMLSDATKRKSYIYDARNHGDSEWSEEFNHDINLEDLRFLLDSQSIKKAIIIGHSMGGFLVCTFALKWPERVEMVINEDMTINEEFIKGTTTHVLSYIKLWEEAVKNIPKELSKSEGIRYAFDYIYDRFVTKKGMEEKEHLYKCNYPIKRTPDGYDVKHHMKVICKHLENRMTKEITELKGVYHGPTYFMMGRLSSYHESLQHETVKKHFPNAEIEVVEDVSHNIHLRSPEIFTDRFLSFYKKYFKIPS